MNEISLNEYFLDNSNHIVDNSNSIIIIDNCRNNLDFIKKLKLEDSGVYQFNNTKARFKFKIDMLYSDPSSVTIDNSSTIHNVVNNSDITRNEDFIITSFDNNIHIVTDITNDKKIQLWGNVIVNDQLKVYNDASFVKNVYFNESVIFQTDVSINNMLEVSNNLLVLGDASINNNLEVSNNLLVLGNSQINNDLDVTGISTMSFARISEGNIDNTNIGLTSRAAARFTTLNVTNDSSLNSNVEFNGPSVFFGGGEEGGGGGGGSPPDGGGGEGGGGSGGTDVEFDNCVILLNGSTIDGSGGSIESTVIGSSYPESGTFTNIVGSSLDISNMKVYNLNNDISISNLQFLKIDMDSSNVCYGDIDLSSIFNELDNKINESNENAGLILDPSNITISNELIVNGDTSFNGDVKMLNGRLYFY